MSHKFTENEEKFLQALENSTLPKTISSLLEFDDDGKCQGHCALGCALLAFAPVVEKEVGARELINDSWTFRSAWTFDFLKREFGITTNFRSPLYYAGESYPGLTTFNDSTELTLKEIAQVLRNNPQVWATNDEIRNTFG